MPCNCDYLEPTGLEKELKRAAILLSYLYKKMGQTVPEWIVKESKDIYASAERLVPLLCKELSNLTGQEKESIIYNARDKTARDLADWYEEHQAADRERIKEETATLKRKQLVKSAKSKLSKEELDALDSEYLE